jgi:hypothetical protein
MVKDDKMPRLGLPAEGREHHHLKIEGSPEGQVQSIFQASGKAPHCPHLPPGADDSVLPELAYDKPIARPRGVGRLRTVDSNARAFDGGYSVGESRPRSISATAGQAFLV